MLARRCVTLNDEQSSWCANSLQAGGTGFTGKYYGHCNEKNLCVVIQFFSCASLGNGYSVKRTNIGVPENKRGNSQECLHTTLRPKNERLWPFECMTRLTRMDSRLRRPGSFRPL